MSEAPKTTPANPRVFDRAVRTHLPALSKRALRLTGNDSDAADLVQDTLVRAFRFWHTFTPGTGLAQWLFTILRNTHYTHCEKASRRRGAHADHKVNTEAVGGFSVPSPADAAEQLETAHRVREALETLPAQFAAAVRLVELEGLSIREAAHAMGCAEGTAMSRAKRGRDRLRAVLTA